MWYKVLVDFSGIEHNLKHLKITLPLPWLPKPYYFPISIYMLLAFFYIALKRTFPLLNLYSVWPSYSYP